MRVRTIRDKVPSPGRRSRAPEVPLRFWRGGRGAQGAFLGGFWRAGGGRGEHGGFGTELLAWGGARAKLCGVDGCGLADVRGGGIDGVGGWLLV